jgi:hypothetical protein
MAIRGLVVKSAKIFCYKVLSLDTRSVESHVPGAEYGRLLEITGAVEAAKPRRNGP